MPKLYLLRPRCGHPCHFWRPQAGHCPWRLQHILPIERRGAFLQALVNP
ncbi:hypothetical protein RHJ63_01230 [Thermosynechococcus sp. JY1334]|nr:MULTISPECIES: hypothetical protein [unclassified Thermosynechococcus]MDR7896941.1 hypothetical protein [Thermosynechococcus sp. JY1332]MDR7904338.1 hypothetical protein [Thermosynechococcus sp. JY1334]